jgi:hypothetical protein
MFVLLFAARTPARVGGLWFSRSGVPLSDDGVRDADFIQSLERGLSVIRAFDAEHPKLSLIEVAVRTGLSRAAARRFLHTLVDLGYMRLEGSQFSLRRGPGDRGGQRLPARRAPQHRTSSATCSNRCCGRPAR